MNNPTRRTLVTGSLAAGGVAVIGRAGRAQAPQWPNGVVKIVVPVPAGTATDLTARIFGEKLSAIWKQPVTVDNKPGGDGLVGIGSFATARDPNALLFSFSTAVSLNPQVYATLPYDAVRDLLPITTTTEVIFAIAVHTAGGITSIPDLIAQSRAKPGALNWAAAPGLPRFVFERFRQESALSMTYVGYRQTNTGVVDLGEGRVQVMIASIQTLQPVLESGKARLIAVATTARVASIPDVQTVVEANAAGLVVPGIGCAFGGRNMSPAVRDQIARDIQAVAQSPGVAGQFAKIGQVVYRTTPAQLAVLLDQQRRALAPLAAIMATAQ